MKKWLIEYREKKGYSQGDLADRSGITREYVSMIENGNRTPSVSVAKRIGKALDFKWEYFFNEESNESLTNGEEIHIS